MDHCEGHYITYNVCFLFKTGEFIALYILIKIVFYDTNLCHVKDRYHLARSIQNLYFVLTFYDTNLCHVKDRYHLARSIQNLYFVLTFYDTNLCHVKDRYHLARSIQNLHFVLTFCHRLYT